MADNGTQSPLVCDLCSEYYTEPLMLSCLHSFCKKCLLKAKDEQGNAEGCLKCHTCDTNVTLPDGRVEGLTQNVWLAHKVKEASLRDSLNSKESIPCSQCTYVDDSSSAAVAFCCNGCSFLCDFCKKGHRRRHETLHHELIDLGVKKVYQDDNEMPRITHPPVYCSQHGDEKLKFYCRKCEVLACRDCILVDHKDHNYIETIKEGDTAREALKKSVTSCVGVIDAVNEAIGNGEVMLRKVDARKKEVDEEIQDTFSSLQSTLEKRCKALLMDAEEIASRKRTVINNQLKDFHKLKEQVSYASQQALSVIECRNLEEVLSVKKLIIDQVTQCDTVFKESSFDIKENEAILTHLDNTTLANKIDHFGGVFEVDPSLCSIENGLAIPLATVEKERLFKVAIPNISDGDAARFLQASFVGSEEEEKVIITNDNNITTVSCTPTSVGEFELSLTIRGHHIIGSPYHLSVKGQRNYTSLPNPAVFSVGGYTYGVAVHSNGEVFASSGNGNIQVFNKDRAAIRTIGSSGNGDGQFSSPFGLLLVGDTLYVTDNELHRVQYFSATTGEYIGKFGSNGTGEGQFSSPRGMTYDGKDSIIVADYSNNRLQVFKKDGTFVRVITCNGAPTDVAIDNEGKIHATIHNQHNVQVFSPDGQTSLTTYNNPNGSSFQYPQGIAIDDEGNRFITSRLGNNFYLNVLSPTGPQIKLLTGFNTPWGVALDKEGYIYFADYGNSRIMKY